MLAQSQRQGCGSKLSFYDRKTVASPAYPCQALVVAKETRSSSSSSSSIVMAMQEQSGPASDTAVQETVCKLAQVPSLNNPCASFQLPRLIFPHYMLEVMKYRAQTCSSGSLPQRLNVARNAEAIYLSEC